MYYSAIHTVSLVQIQDSDLIIYSALCSVHVQESNVIIVQSYWYCTYVQFNYRKEILLRIHLYALYKYRRVILLFIQHNALYTCRRVM